MDDAEPTVALITAPVPWFLTRLAWDLWSEEGRRLLDVPQDGVTESLWTVGDTLGLVVAGVWVASLALRRRVARTGLG